MLVCQSDVLKGQRLIRHKPSKTLAISIIIIVVILSSALDGSESPFPPGPTVVVLIEIAETMHIRHEIQILLLQKKGRYKYRSGKTNLKIIID